MSQKTNSKFEFQAHICVVIIIGYKVRLLRLGQVKPESKNKEKTKIDSFRSGLDIGLVFPKIQECGTLGHF